MLRTATPRSWATLLRLKSLVTILPESRLASSISLRSTSLHLREVRLDDLHVHVRHLLDPLQDVQAAPAAVALHRVRGVGHLLQLAQHELGHDQRPLEEAGLADVRDAPVDDHGGVEHLVLVKPRGVLEGGDDARGLEPLAPARPDHDAHVDEEDDQDRVDEVLGLELEPGDHPPDEVGAEEAGDAPHQGPDHVVGGHPVEPQLQADDAEGERYAEREPRSLLPGDGAVVPPGPAEDEDDQGAEQDEPHGGGLSGAVRGARDG